MSTPPTVADLLARCLLAQGAHRVFRSRSHPSVPLPGLDVLDVLDDDVATLLADADGRLAAGKGAGPGVALLSEARLRLSSQPGLVVEAHPVTDPSELPLLVAGWSLGEVLTACELNLGALDLAAPVPEGIEPLDVSAASDQLVTLSPSLAGFSMVLLVGPGVVRAGEAPAVAEAARLTGAGVVATPGAVGVLPLDHPAWLGVVGLQAHDTVRSGLADAELVVTAGVDPTEAPPLADTVQVLEVEPWHLALMARHWPEAGPEQSTGGSDLARVLESLVGHSSGATADLVATTRETLELLPAGGVVAADAGPAGLWLARGLVTGSATVVVPARPCPGFAAAAAFVAALDDRPALAVTTAPVTSMTEAVVALAAERDLPLVIEVWGDPAGEGERRLVDRLAAAAAAGGRACTPVPVDLSGTQGLVDALGPVTAWQEGA